MIDELFARPIILQDKVTTIVPKVPVPNIWNILDLVEETLEEKMERKRRKHEKIEATKKVKVYSLQSEQDRAVSVYEMVFGVSGSRQPAIYVERGGVADPPSATIADLVLVADGTYDYSRT